MFNPFSSLPQDNESPDDKPHAGKGMVMKNGDSITLILDCVSCPRLELGPIPLPHLATIIQMLTHMAETYGIDIEAESGAKIVADKRTNSEVTANDMLTAFERMPVDPDEHKDFVKSTFSAFPDADDLPSSPPDADPWDSNP